MIFDQPVNIKEGRLFGLLINPEDRINSVMIILLDNNRKSAYRYYIKLNINEENFVLLSRIGFKNNQNLSANEIKEIRFIFYTSKPKHDQPFKIEIGKFYTLKITLNYTILSKKMISFSQKN